MKLLCITDLHGDAAALRRIMADAGAVDIVLLGGDLTNFGAPDGAEKLVRLAQSWGAPVRAVAGNCDSAEIDRRLADLGVSLHGRGIICQEVGIHGISAAPPWRCDMYEFTEEELATALQAGYEEIAGAKQHVVLAHAPPRDGKVDRTFAFQHVGSTSLASFVQQTQPALVVCGHVHEARGTDMLGCTTVVNCGPAKAGYYALAELEDEVTVELRRI